MVTGLIPHRYAMALYKYAMETKTGDKVYEEMKRVADAFSSNPGLEKVLSNPYVKSDDKKRVLLAAAGENPGDDFRRFVTLIIDHRREEFAYLMALAYRDIYRKENNISQVRITTAVELPAGEMDKLRGVVERAVKASSLEYDYVVDPTIIGGFIIDVDYTRMDSSVSCELEQLRHNLLISN